MKYWLYTLGQNLPWSLFKFLSGKSCSASLWGSCNTTTPCGRGISRGCLPLHSWILLWFCFVFSKTTGEQLLCFTSVMSFHWMCLSAGDSALCLRCAITDPVPLVLRLPSSMDLSDCTEASLLWLSLFFHSGLQVGITQMFSTESQEMHCWENLCSGLGSFLT